MKALALTLALCVLIASAGCGGSDSTAATEQKAEPDVAAPTGAPPKKLVLKDIEKGTGAVARAGDRATVRWAGFLYKGAKMFYSSWNWKFQDRFTFTIDSGQVIPGWDRGMRGMKVGGRREMIIPPALAYGSTGTSYVPPNETLIYVVDLVHLRGS